MNDEQLLRFIQTFPQSDIASAYRLGRKIANMELTISYHKLLDAVKEHKDSPKINQ